MEKIIPFTINDLARSYQPQKWGNKIRRKNDNHSKR